MGPHLVEAGGCCLQPSCPRRGGEWPEARRVLRMDTCPCSGGLGGWHSWRVAEPAPPSPPISSISSKGRSRGTGLEDWNNQVESNPSHPKLLPLGSPGSSLVHILAGQALLTSGPDPSMLPVASRKSPALGPSCSWASPCARGNLGEKTKAGATTVHTSDQRNWSQSTTVSVPSGVCVSSRQETASFWPKTPWAGLPRW